MSTHAAFRRLGNLPARVRGVNSLAALLLALYTGAGCLIRPPRTIHHVSPGSWPATQGSAQRAPFRTETAPEARPPMVWDEATERGMVTTPIVHGDLLILGSSGRVLTTAAAPTGHEYWHRRFNGPVVGSPLRTGDTVLVALASRDGRVYAYTLARGRKVWLRRLHAPITSEPVLDAGRIYAGTLRSELYALETRNGGIIWRIRSAGAPAGAPVLHEGALLLTTAHDTLMRVDADKGIVAAVAPLPGTATASPALDGQRLLVPVHPRGIASYDARTLALLRLDTLDAPVLAAPAIAEDGSAYLWTRDGTLWRLSGGAPERLAALGGAARESLTLVRNGVLVGLLDGTLVLLRRDGREVWRQTFRGSLRAPVALAGGAIYVALLTGRLLTLQCSGSAPCPFCSCCCPAPPWRRTSRTVLPVRPPVPGARSASPSGPRWPLRSRRRGTA
ncbi:MAG: hypothetical protein FIB01_13390 [Gemmatimonadetes bacterium]|nr:hypothetical protein [Gemmatimonadota bacterium]